MGKYTRKCGKGCSGGGEVAVMEIPQAGVRTRGRAVAVEEAGDNSGSAKRRKVGNGELRLSSSKSARIKARDGEDIFTISKKFGDSAEKDDSSDPCAEATSLSSGDVPASCCSSNGSITEKMKCADLEERAEIETTVRFNLDKRESTPTSKFKEESGELDSSTTAKPSVRIDSRREIPAEKTPPAAELEEFFASAEKDLHKSFKEKYNYDIVNDVPMKGRFEWVQLKP